MNAEYIGAKWICSASLGVHAVDESVPPPSVPPTPLLLLLEQAATVMPAQHAAPTTALTTRGMNIN
jgi:hypothetical protein